MPYGRGSVKSDAINAHKSMAMGKTPSGADAVGKYPPCSSHKRVGTGKDNSNRDGRL